MRNIWVHIDIRKFWSQILGVSVSTSVSPLKHFSFSLLYSQLYFNEVKEWWVSESSSPLTDGANILLSQNHSRFPRPVYLTIRPASLPLSVRPHPSVFLGRSAGIVEDRGWGSGKKERKKMDFCVRNSVFLCSNPLAPSRTVQSSALLHGNN